MSSSFSAAFARQASTALEDGKLFESFSDDHAQHSGPKATKCHPSAPTFTRRKVTRETLSPDQDESHDRLFKPVSCLTLSFPVHYPVFFAINTRIYHRLATYQRNLSKNIPPFNENELHYFIVSHLGEFLIEAANFAIK